jgi:membrane-bound lytic murein transglycosylase F
MSLLSVEHNNRLQLSAVDEEVETETLIQQVANGDIEVTIADSHLLDIELASGLAVKSAFDIGEERPNTVAVRQSNPKLLKALDSFIKKNYKGVVYNVLYKKYFKDKRSINRIARERRDKLKDGKISPYDQITRRYAEKYGFDWRLITAQMYQESRFKPGAKSFAGAKGLLQVMPKTAKSMGFKDLEKPETGIHAGVKYLDWVRNRFKEKLPFSERTWFTLASYNAGYGHVLDARRLAKQKGWDPDKWFGNVERAMLLLSQKKYYRKAKHGFVRGLEPVTYVSNIRERYNAYVSLTEDQFAGL